MRLRFVFVAPVFALLAAACGHSDTPDVVDVVVRDVVDVPSPCGDPDPSIVCYPGLRDRACALDQEVGPTVCLPTTHTWQCGGNFVARSACGCAAYGNVTTGVECPCPSYGPPPNNVCPTDAGNEAAVPPGDGAVDSGGLDDGGAGDAGGADADAGDGT